MEIGCDLKAVPLKSTLFAWVAVRVTVTFSRIHAVGIHFFGRSILRLKFRQHQTSHQGDLTTASEHELPHPTVETSPTLFLRLFSALHCFHPGVAYYIHISSDHSPAYVTVRIRSPFLLSCMFLQDLFQPDTPTYLGTVHTPNSTDPPSLPCTSLFPKSKIFSYFFPSPSSVPIILYYAGSFIRVFPTSPDDATLMQVGKWAFRPRQTHPGSAPDRGKRA